MPVSAILLVGSRPLLDAANGESSLADSSQSPLASIKVLGRSVVERTIAHLQMAGIKTISVTREDGLGPGFLPGALLRQASKGFKRVLLIRLGAYAELDYAELLKFHYQAGATVTRVCDIDGPLDIWVLDPAPTVRSGIRLDSPEIGIDLPLLYLTKGYVNRLSDTRTLRRLAVDSFLGRSALRPVGREIKPGIWCDRGARLHPSAQVVPPAYIGRGTRVRSSALIASFSALEQCCVVDRGAMIEDASVLPHTYIGKGIDIANAVVDQNRFVHLRSDLAITIDDRKMIGRVPSGWHSFFYGDKNAELARPPAKPFDLAPVDLSPVEYAESRPGPAIRLFSKGEV